MPNRRKMSEILRGLMYEKGVGVAKVCKDTGLSRTPIYAILREEAKRPLPTTLKTIADYFGVTVSYLMGAEEEKPGPPPETLPPLTESRRDYLEKKYINRRMVGFRANGLSDAQLYRVLNYIEYISTKAEGHDRGDD